MEAEAGSSPTLAFTVTSDPPLAEAIKHTLTKSDGSKANKRFKVESGRITFRKVRVEDSGTYTINCCSDEGEVGQATLELEVTPPQPSTRQPPHSHGTTQTGKELLLSCYRHSITPYFPGSTIVRSDDVGYLASHLCKNASHKWREIGLALGFLDGELKSISLSFPGATAQQLLTELLSQWSQWPTAAHPDAPTMERLRDALRSGLVELGAVASDLYELRNFLPSK